MHSSSNRSTAAQFFQEEPDDEDYPPPGSGAGGQLSSFHGIDSSNSRRSSIGYGQTQNIGTGPTPRPGTSTTNNNNRNRTGSESFDQNDYREEAEVAELLTKAAVTSNDQLKLDSLSKVKDIIVNRQPTLLDNFLDETLNFLLDSNIHIRRYILQFIQDACEADPEIIPKVLHNMMMMLSDSVVSVQKKAIQVMAKVYKLTLMWLCRSKIVTDDMESAWNSVNELKKFILRQIDSDNDAIRTHTVKFIETIILLQTPLEPDSILRDKEFCLDHVPITLKVARPRKLEEDAKILFDELLKFHGSRHATSVNLMTCMSSIAIIAKLRPHFMGRVVSALEKLNAILPPTLERSQVQSVRKHMKSQLIGLLKHPRAVDYYENITTLLSDLGATNHELSKALPNWDQIRSEKRKRQREKLLMEKEDMSNKKLKLDDGISSEITSSLPVEDDDEEEEEDEDEVMETLSLPTKKEEETDQFETFVLSKLDIKTAADLVISSMESLPEELPPHFMSAYTPVSISLESQVKHVARLLAAQITAHQLGPGAALQSRLKDDEDEVEGPIPTIVSSQPVKILPNEALLDQSKMIMGTGKKKSAPKPTKLSELTVPLSEFEKQRQVSNALRRILFKGDILNSVRRKLVSSLATNATTELRRFVMQYIKEDIRNRFDLGIDWLFNEFSVYQGFLQKSFPILIDNSVNRYEWTFVNFISAILERAPESEKAKLASRVYLELPLIPEKGVDLLKVFYGNELHAQKMTELLMDLVSTRSLKNKKLHYMTILLDFCSHAVDTIRNHSVDCVIKLYEKGEGVKVIEDKAVNAYLSSIKSQHPPEILFMEGLGRPFEQREWTEDLAKATLQLYLQLLYVNHKLIDELGKVYVDTPAVVKRTILRLIEPSVRSMGMESPELMGFIDSFPKGTETLITRIIHILTDRSLPSADLVSRVKSLYSQRVSDVRFLIPVLNGLSKTEIKSELPKLIQLNPNVVKEVFNRLLGIHADAKIQHKSPITPVELMVELHCMDGITRDIKSVIRATSLCFAESDIFTQDVLAEVINQLVEITPLPTLLMRTVIQSLSLYPKLQGFVMNVLGKLIRKKVWTQPKIWEGFVKCCQRTLPKSIPVLLMIPPPQAKLVLEETPDIRDTLANYVMNITEQQRAQIPSQLLEAILYYAQDRFQKTESYYDYENEVTPLGEIQSNHQITVGGNTLIKAEPGSPGESGIKNEPMDYMQSSEEV